MSGEQQVVSPGVNFENVFVGGVPKGYPNTVLQQHHITPLKGCVISLQVNGEEKDLIRAAKDGAYITECYSSACYQNPCRNGATCKSYNDHWACECPAEFTGPFCERETCILNPCQYSGTCLPDLHMGYSCICPYGKHGQNCENDVVISRPMFAGNVIGYSSFLEYEQSFSSRYHIEIRIAFATNDLLQKSILLYQGQTDKSYLVNDFFAVGLYSGFVLYFLNLGSGTTVLKSADRMNPNIPVHRLLVGCHRRYAWLQIDSQPKIMGLAPGQLLALNALSGLFVGGHPSFNLSLLPDEIIGWSGFRGCILNINARNSPSGNFLELAKVVNGRNIDQCNASECNMITCLNGGSCHEANQSFRCECSEGFSGPLCAEKMMPCSNSSHKCSLHSKCVPVDHISYKCICPFHKSGPFCENDIIISTPLFDGEESYLLVQSQNIRHDMDLMVKFKPFSSNGVLFYAFEPRNRLSQDFLSLSLASGFLYYKFNLGFENDATTVLKSQRRIDQGVWHTVSFGRYKRAAYLKVDDELEVTSVSPPGREILDVGTQFFIGGIPEEILLKRMMYDKINFFHGCISRLIINGQDVDFQNGNIEGWNISNCDTNNCSCDSEEKNEHCIGCNCKENVDNCRPMNLCENFYCLNGGSCIQSESSPSCVCDAHWRGLHCDISVNLKDEFQFDGNGYLFILNTKTVFADFSVTDVAFDFSTNQSSGLLLWNGNVYQEDGDYLGIGLRNGLLHLVWSLGWLSQNEIFAELSHNALHSIHVQITGQKLILELDGRAYYSEVVGKFHELNTHGYYHFGGLYDAVALDEGTGGFFSSAFIGCIKNIHISQTKIDAKDITEAKNIKQCE